MAKTFQDMLNGYLNLTHRRAVYTTMAEYLRRYLPNDLGGPKDVISVSDGVFSAVQEGIIASIVAEFEIEIQELNGQLLAFEGEATLPESKPEKARKKVAK